MQLELCLLVCTQITFCPQICSISIKVIREWKYLWFYSFEWADRSQHKTLTRLVKLKICFFHRFFASNKFETEDIEVDVDRKGKILCSEQCWNWETPGLHTYVMWIYWFIFWSQIKFKSHSHSFQCSLLNKWLYNSSSYPVFYEPCKCYFELNWNSPKG